MKSKTTGSTIARNASWLFAATTMQKVVAFVAFTIAARIVGPTVIGEYFFAVAMTSTFVVIADLGMTSVVIRGLAAHAEEGRRLLGAAIRLKLFLIPLSVIVALVYGAVRQIDPIVWQTLIVMVLVMSADALHLLFYGALRGKQLLRFEAIGMFVGQLLSGAVAVSAAFLGWGAPGLASALLIGSVWNVGWSWLQLGREGIQMRAPTKADISLLIRQAIPFAFAGIFVKVYSYLDTMMIEAFHDKVAVGNYAVAYKVTYAFQFIPLVFVAALYPAMSSVFADRDTKKMKEVFAGSLRIMAIIAAPLAAGISAIAPKAIVLMYHTSFLGAIAPLAILSWVLIPIFLDFPVGSLLNATHRAHLKTSAMGATMVVNALLNFLLVPSLGPVGAAWAGLGSFTFLFAIGIVFAWKDLPSPTWLMSLLARSALVAASVWFSVHWTIEIMPLLLVILFGGSIGVIVLLLTKLLTIQEVASVVRWMHARIRPSQVEEEDVHV
ncbi:MAG: flippase [Candidatus Uhrbacteria bacterium]|nr:flippase [Candidatus Uhrbacteria bacterium]